MWIIFKNKFLACWLWLKEHWQIPFLIVWTLLVFIMTRRNTDALVEVIQAKKQSYKDQIEVLKNSHRDEILKRDRLLQEYERNLLLLEDEFKKRNEKISEDHKKTLKDVIIKSKTNPDEIRRRIEEEFNFKFVE